MWFRSLPESKVAGTLHSSGDGLSFPQFFEEAKEEE
jgi:hypothetical protein